MKNRWFTKEMLKKHLLFFSISLIYIVFLQVTKIYSPTLLLGFPVPTTGVTRAWLSFFRGDLNLAFEYNRMFLLAPFLGYYVYKSMLFNEKRDVRIVLVLTVIFFINFII